MKLSSPKFSFTSLACVLAAFAVIGCESGDDRAAWWQNENERIGLEQQLELKKFRYENDFVEGAETHVTLKVTTQKQAAKIAELGRRRSELENEVAKLDESWASFRQTVLAEHRRGAIGTSLGTLTVSSGRKFENAKVAEIDDAGVTVRHANGSARLRFSDLSADQQLKFGLEPDLALAAEEQERAQAADYERWIEKEMVAVRSQQNREQELAISSSRDARRKADDNKALAAQRHLVAANTRALGQPSRNFSRSYSRGPRYYSTYVYRPYYYRSMCYPRIKTYGAVIPGSRRFNYPTRSPRVNYTAPTVSPRKRSISSTTLNSIP